jgi:hypothetical protein
VTEGKNRSADSKQKKAVLPPKNIVYRRSDLAETIEGFDRGIGVFRNEWRSPNFQQLL